MAFNEYLSPAMLREMYEFETSRLNFLIEELEGLYKEKKMLRCPVCGSSTMDADVTITFKTTNAKFYNGIISGQPGKIKIEVSVKCVCGAKFDIQDLEEVKYCIVCGGIIKDKIYWKSEDNNRTYYAHPSCIRTTRGWERCED